MHTEFVTDTNCASHTYTHVQVRRIKEAVGEIAQQVLQCVAVWCCALQCVAACCSMMQCGAVRRRALRHVVVCCSVLQGIAVSCSVLQ